MKWPRFPWETMERALPAERRDSSELSAARYAWAGEHLPPLSQIADVGCGYGYGAAMLREKHIVVGVDIAREAIAYAAERYPGMYVIANAEAQTFAGFDVVVCLECLSHMLDPYAWIKNLEVPRLVISAPLTPSTAVYPWRKHDIPGEMFRNMFTPKWQIRDEMTQEASPTEVYMTVYATR